MTLNWFVEAANNPAVIRAVGNSLLAASLAARGWLDSMTDDTGHQLPNIVYEGLDRAELVDWVERFYGEYYFRPRAVWRIVRKAIFNSEERRRLAPLPPAWAAMPPDRLEMLLRAAQAVGTGDPNLGGGFVVERRVGELQQPPDLLVAGAARLDLLEARLQAAEELAPRAPARDQPVLEVRIAPHRPDLAQHLVEHARRAPGAPLGAQLRDQRPALGAEQAQHDLAVGERGVVVRDLAQPRLHR